MVGASSIIQVSAFAAWLCWLCYFLPKSIGESNQRTIFTHLARQHINVSPLLLELSKSVPGSKRELLNRSVATVPQPAYLRCVCHQSLLPSKQSQVVRL